MRKLLLSYALLFFFGTGFLFSQQATIAPGENPATVVKMGDSLVFKVNLSASTSINGTELEVIMPDEGFEILPSTPNLANLSADKKTARITTGSLSIISTEFTIYVKALCNADEVSVSDRVITYNLYASAGGTSAIRTTSTQSIGNFNDPIINVPVIAPVQVSLNQNSTRIIEVSQTAPNSHIKNMKVNVVCDRAGFEISKIEISKNGINGWTDITASALDDSPANGYTYYFNRTNTFGSTALNYTDSKLSTGETFYIKETFKLSNCNSGVVNYNFEYGDGATFCGIVRNRTATASVAMPGYLVDYVRTANTIPTAYDQEGFVGVYIRNNSPEANLEKVFTSIYISDYNTTNSAIFQRAVLTNGNSATVVAEIPMQNNTAITSTSMSGGASNLGSHANIWKVDLNTLPQATNATERAAYEAAGLADLDGDGIYSDIAPGKLVYIRFYYKLQYDPSRITCSNAGIPSVSIYSRAYFDDVCGTTYSYARTNNASSSTGFLFQHGAYAIPLVNVDNQSLAQGDLTNLIVTDQNGAPSNGFTGFPWTVNAERIHKVIITLPVGLEYTGGTITITPSGYATANATEVSYDAINRIISFRNPTRANTFPLVYNIPIEATGVEDISKIMNIKHTFQMNGDPAGPITFGCYDVVVPYIQRTPCDRLELMDFVAERTSFGWVASDQYERDTTTRANRNTPGINLRAAGPYDNMSFTSVIEAKNNISLAAGEQVIVELAYSVATTAAYLTMPVADASRKIVLYYKQNGGADFNQVAEFSSTVNNNLITTVNTNPNHKIAINIESFIGSGKPITQLLQGDQLKVVYLLQVTENVPKIPADVTVSSEVYTLLSGTKDACYQLLQTLKLFNYNLTTIGVPSSDMPNLNVTHTGGTFLRWQLGNSAGATDEVFPNEYRPNVFFRNLVLSIDALIDIHSLVISGYTASSEPTSAETLVEGDDYTVTYSGGKTIVTLLKSYLMQEAYVNYFRGIWIHGSYDVICAPTSTTISIATTLERYDFPSSESTKGYVATSGTGRLYASGTLTDVKRYQYMLATTEATVSPSGRIAEWDFTLTNASNWAATDPNLPYSWFAFECDPGLTPYELRDVTNGVLIANVNDFVNYGTNKYWVKLGNLNLPASRNYSISCTYTACVGTPGLNVVYGMNKVAYPDDPANGFATVYSSQGYFCNSTSMRLGLTPPSVDFGGTLVHTPNSTGGTNIFCDEVDFTATFINGTSNEISGMRLRVNLPEEGVNYSGTMRPQVRLGNGTTWTAWENVQGASQMGQVFEIVLGNSLELDGVNNGNYQAQVQFQLRLSCGLENARAIYANFIGESGCGAQTSKAYNSGQIKVAGLSTPPDYYVSDLVLTQTTYSGPGSGENGEMTLSGIYTAAAATTTGDRAIIDLPENVNLASQNSASLYFTQNGSRLISSFPPGNAGRQFAFNLTLRPTNPAEWGMDTSYIYVRTGIIDSLTCDNVRCAILSVSELSDSVTVSLQKLEIDFDGTVIANSRYNDETSERVVIQGTLVNNSDISASRLTIDLMTFNGLDYVEVNHLLSGGTVSDVPAYGTKSFTMTANILHTEDVCNLLLVLRKYNSTSGSVNAYLADSVAIPVPVPVYSISAVVDEMCQMDGGVVIGEMPINDYSYRWNPSDYLSRSNIARPTFTYDYINNPLPDDTVLEYFVSIIRPNGCVTVDTIFVPLRGIPSVDDVSDITLCSGSSFSLSFSDATNTGGLPTTYKWTIANGPTVGLPASGQSSSINVSQLRNTTSQPVT
ncbi:MAG: hypothetical protein LBQ22_07795, partial [Bacteroidales bacterium]|nr:hypothetical protein [Bacteroidales bacterium]